MNLSDIENLDLEARAHSEHAHALRLWLRLLTCSQLIEKRVRAGLGKGLHLHPLLLAGAHRGAGGYIGDGGNAGNTSFIYISVNCTYP